MKLKYYMRGLGIGILITTLILSLSNTKEHLSDKEIMQRAAELGMVMDEKDNANLEKVIKGVKPTGATQTPSPTVEPSLKPTVTLKPTIAPTNKPTQAPVPTKKPIVSTDKKEISFTIKGGMTSDQVAKVLEQAGLIKDADEFNRYIEQAGKASSIRVGTYSVNKGISYRDIVSKITSK